MNKSCLYNEGETPSAMRPEQALLSLSLALSLSLPPSLSLSLPLSLSFSLALSQCLSFSGQEQVIQNRKRAVYFRQNPEKSPIFPQKSRKQLCNSATEPPKSRIFPKKSRIFPPKTPMFLQKIRKRALYFRQNP